MWRAGGAKVAQVGAQVAQATRRWRWLETCSSLLGPFPNQAPPLSQATPSPKFPTTIDVTCKCPHATGVQLFRLIFQPTIFDDSVPVWQVLPPSAPNSLKIVPQLYHDSTYPKAYLFQMQHEPHEIVRRISDCSRTRRGDAFNACRSCGLTCGKSSVFIHFAEREEIIRLITCGLGLLPATPCSVV